MHEIIEGTWSGSVVIKNSGSVAKKIFVDKAIDFGCLEREVYWLTIMDEFDRVPSLIFSGFDYIEMQYMGRRIDKETIPKDWEEQMEYILNVLKTYDCSHNDIKPEDILVKDGVVNLVDFGWATEIGVPIPKSWPQGIGREFRVGIHAFNDRHAFVKSIEKVLSQGD